MHNWRESMTPEQHAQAQALIKKHKGKITSGEWDIWVQRDCPNHDIKINNDGATETDIALMSDAPTLLALLERAVERIKVQNRNSQWVDENITSVLAKQRENNHD
jgi:subtilisin-like proprotein convertase family protein